MMIMMMRGGGVPLVSLECLLRFLGVVKVSVV